MFELHTFFEIHKVDIDKERVEIDGISVPENLYHLAGHRATESGKTHFIGLVEVRDPNFAHPYAGLSTEEFWKSLNGRKMEGMYLPVTEFAFSDSREAIINHGCGKLLWVLPHRNDPNSHMMKEPALTENRDEYQVVRCAACNADIPVTNGSTDKLAVNIERGSLAIQTRAGDLTAEELATRENIKFQIYVCGTCFMEDPDLCKFFNKIGFTVR